MPFRIPAREDLSRSNADIQRFRNKAKEQIKNRAKDIILEEAVLTGESKGKKVKIPIRKIEIPEFTRGVRSGGQSGIGQGGGKDGKGKGLDEGDELVEGQGSTGSDGTDSEMVMVDIDLDDMIDLAFGSIDLPNLKDRIGESALSVKSRLQLKDISQSGSLDLLLIDEVSRKGIGRFYAFLENLKQITGRNDLDCCAALVASFGDLSRAQFLLEDINFSHSLKDVEPFPILDSEDLSYFNLEPDEPKKISVVIMVALDTSGSMTKEMQVFIKRLLYKMKKLFESLFYKVTFVFIIHDELAKQVDEYAFFHKAAQGGTHCHSAYEMMTQICKMEYPVEKHNIYGLHFTDGDDASSALERSVKSLREFIDLGINLFGYCDLYSGNDPSSSLFSALQSRFPVVPHISSLGKLMLVGKRNFPFVGLHCAVRDDESLILSELFKSNRK